MKVGIIGAGNVGSACLLALVMRGPACEIVVIDRNQERAEGIVTDLQYGATLSPPVQLCAGDYADLAGAALVMITAGQNEKSGGAVDRSDAAGRLKLLDTNVGVYCDIIPQVVAAAPDAVILVITDPPDPLADLARQLAGHDRVLSSGTFLELALPFPPGAPACYQPDVSRGAGTRRAWHLASVSVVFCAHLGNARDVCARGCRAVVRAASAERRDRRALCKYHDHRRHRCESVWHRHGGGPHRAGHHTRRAFRHARRKLQSGLRRYSVAAQRTRALRSALKRMEAQACLRSAMRSGSVEHPNSAIGERDVERN